MYQNNKPLLYEAIGGFKMDNQDVRVIKEIYELLNSAINDKRQIYVHLVEEGNQKWKETLNREQQLQFICELVMQQIENNFEWEE